MYTIIGADGAEYGPITGDQLRQWIAEGRANGQTRVRAEGSTDWKPLAQYLEFAAALTGKASPSPITSTIPVTIGPIPTAPRNNPMAVAGLVLGIISVTLAFCCYGIPFNILAIIFSLMALSQISTDPYSQRGRGLAIAGLVLGIISVFVAVLLGVLIGSFSVLQNLAK